MRESSRQPTPNFAGSYFAVTWGCGSDGCAALAIIDGRDGAIYGPPPETARTRTGFVASPRTSECYGIGLRPDSRLLFIEYSDYSSGEAMCERSYYEWKDKRYFFLRKAKLPPKAARPNTAR